VYDIPWPSSFSSFLDVMKVFLVDVITLTKARALPPHRTLHALLFARTVLACVVFVLMFVESTSVCPCLAWVVGVAFRVRIPFTPCVWLVPECAHPPPPPSSCCRQTVPSPCPTTSPCW
jgi:hypothetical protein